MSGSSVQGGRLRHWSPSQISTFELCERRWAFEKVNKLPGDYDSGAQAFGTNRHNELEAAGKTGKAPTHPLSIVALELLPPPNGRLVEYEASIAKNPTLLAADVPAKGFIDRLDYTDPNLIDITDYKTRGNFRYTLSPDDLARNVQMVTYGMWAVQKFNPPAVRLQHFYLKSEPLPEDVQTLSLEMQTAYYRAHVNRYFRFSSVSMTADEVRLAFRPVESTVARMAKAATCSTGAELRPTFDTPEKKTCTAYGKRCPYYDACPRPSAFAGLSSSATPAPQTGASSVSDLLATRHVTPVVKVRATGINPPDAAPPTRSATPVPTAGTTSSTATPAAASTEPHSAPGSTR